MLPYTPLHHLLFASGAPDVLVMTSANRSSEPIAYEDEDALERLVRHRRRLSRSASGRSHAGSRTRSCEAVPRAGDAPSRARLRARGRRDASHRSSGTRARRGPQERGDAGRRWAGVREPAHRRPRATTRRHERSRRRSTISSRCTRSVGTTFLSCTTPTLSTARRRTPPGSAARRGRGGSASSGARRVGARGARRMGERVVGVSLDGTGYGDDGSIWGGEFFVGSIRGGLERVAHLRPAALAWWATVRRGIRFRRRRDSSTRWTGFPISTGSRSGSPHAMSSRAACCGPGRACFRPPRRAASSTRRPRCWGSLAP